MDIATHALTGLALGVLAETVTGASGEAGKALIWGAFIASQAPDFDCITRLWGGKSGYLKYHRTYTHTVPVMALMAGIITLVLKLIFPRAVAAHIFFWAFVSMLVHLIMDLVTSYGIMALWPFKKDMLALDWVMIIDPFILLVMICGTLLWYGKRLAVIPLFTAIYVIITIYILARAIIHSKLLHYLQSQYPNAQSYSVLPTYGLNNWNFVVERQLQPHRRQLLTGYMHFKTRQLVPVKKYTTVYTPLVNAASQSTLGRIFKHFARHLVIMHRNTKNGLLVVMADLRFNYWNRYPFAAYIWLDENLKVCKEKLRSSDGELTMAVAWQDIKGGRL